MKRPTSITILGNKIKIVYVKEVIEPNILGTYCHEDKLITLVYDKDWRSHLFHECIHANLIISGISELLTGDTHEAVVCALESGLKEFFHIKYKKFN